ncbi:TetR/AcrR family transcriptional regulator [Promicromonospora thailandica]|uniref:Transcriptional regulator, TetR family n=1 Tax=Promicromonospora thailandica TaxID=765201 RepID=A0A9X2JT80_9MICO|nr:TetR/AcrR family transcriptional regulator [Promicromonospora thailandica]MCP2262681.1 transcriptional regulator, TetR family [Promicromonospora thailandica]
MTDQVARPAKRADAARNRQRILEVARAAMDEPGADPSMAEISRRAGVGMATLYRNFPSRLDLVSELYRNVVDEICAAAEQAQGAADPGAAFFGWLEEFHAAGSRKGPLASLLLADAGGGTASDTGGGTGGGTAVLNTSRARVIAAGEPVYAAARAAGAVRSDLPLGPVLDAIVAVGRVAEDPEHTGAVFRLVLDGLRCGGHAGAPAAAS